MIKQYEPEDINGCMMMLTNDNGRYILKTDYDLLDNRLGLLINRILSLQENNTILKSKLEQEQIKK